MCWCVEKRRGGEGPRQCCENGNRLITLIKTRSEKFSLFLFCSPVRLRLCVEQNERKCTKTPSASGLRERRIVRRQLFGVDDDGECGRERKRRRRRSRRTQIVQCCSMRIGRTSSRKEKRVFPSMRLRRKMPLQADPQRRMERNNSLSLSSRLSVLSVDLFFSSSIETSRRRSTTQQQQH